MSNSMCPSCNCYCINPLTKSYCNKYLRNYGDNGYSLYISKLINNINNNQNDNDYCSKINNNETSKDSEDDLYKRLKQQPFFPTYTEYLNWKRSQDFIQFTETNHGSCLL